MTEQSEWDHRPHITKMISPTTREVKYLCSFGSPFDNRSRLCRYFSQDDNLGAMEWANKYDAIWIDMTKDIQWEEE